MRSDDKVDDNDRKNYLLGQPQNLSILRYHLFTICVDKCNLLSSPGWSRDSGYWNSYKTTCGLQPHISMFSNLCKTWREISLYDAFLILKSDMKIVLCHCYGYNTFTTVLNLSFLSRSTLE